MSQCIIRQMGDSVLHTVPKKALALKSSQMHHLLTVMRDGLNRYGGVGIACNQCRSIPKPYQIMIIGVDDPKVRAKVKERYPSESIPRSFVMVNPVIIKSSQARYYPEHGEGCLSVLGPLRAKVSRARMVEVSYTDELGQCRNKIFRGFTAHIIQHEYDHLNGVVYLQKIFKEFNVDQIQLFVGQLNKELLRRGSSKPTETLNPGLVLAPSIAINRRPCGALKVYEETLPNIFETMLAETLQGMLIYLNKENK